MPGYATVGSNRLNEALPFYDALLAVVGVTTLFEHSSGGRVYGTPGGTMFGFAAHSREDVDRFHAKALELGGTSEGAPGPRGPEGSNAYLAYVRDLEGNKLCAFNMG